MRSILVVALTISSLVSTVALAKSKEPLDVQRQLSELIMAERSEYANTLNQNILLKPSLADQLTAFTALGYRVAGIDYKMETSFLGTNKMVCVANIEIVDKNGKTAAFLFSEAGLMDADCQ